MTGMIIIAWLSSISLALMVIFDRLMMGNCYEDDSHQAWFVSSFLGSIFGIIASCLYFLYFLITSTISFNEVWPVLQPLLYPHGVLMIVAGTFSVQVLYHYFQCFANTSHSSSNETTVAIWLASAPIWIYLAILILQKLLVIPPTLLGLKVANTSWVLGILIAGTVLALIKFEISSHSHISILDTKKYKHLILMMLFIVIYTLLLSGILRSFTEQTIHIAFLSLFYWIGFAAGTRVLLRRKNREAFTANLPTLKNYIPVILIAEVIGTAVFFLEFQALTSLDPTVVNLIIGSHVLLVYMFVVYLRRLRKKLDATNSPSVNIVGLTINTKTLPRKEGSNQSEIAWLLISLALLGAINYYIVV